jgi:hypothetical protein
VGRPATLGLISLLIVTSVCNGYSYRAGAQVVSPSSAAEECAPLPQPSGADSSRWHYEWNPTAESSIAGTEAVTYEFEFSSGQSPFFSVNGYTLVPVNSFFSSWWIHESPEFRDYATVIDFFRQWSVGLKANDREWLRSQFSAEGRRWLCQDTDFTQIGKTAARCAFETCAEFDPTLLPLELYEFRSLPDWRLLAMIGPEGAERVEDRSMISPPNTSVWLFSRTRDGLQIDAVMDGGSSPVTYWIEIPTE